MHSVPTINGTYFKPCSHEETASTIFSVHQVWTGFQNIFDLRILQVSLLTMKSSMVSWNMASQIRDCCLKYCRIRVSFSELPVEFHCKRLISQKSVQNQEHFVMLPVVFDKIFPTWLFLAWHNNNKRISKSRTLCDYVWNSNSIVTQLFFATLDNNSSILYLKYWYEIHFVLELCI